MTIKVKPLQEAITEAEASRHTFCLASPGSDEEFHAYLLGFESALSIFRKAIEAVDPATIRAEALRDKIAAKAREYAEHYPQSSDGRNTFLIFAEWVEALALIDKEKDHG
jgi:hypothetical protein